MDRFPLALVFLTVTVAVAGVGAKFLRGELRTTQEWAFLARFCFLSHYGRFEYNIEYSKEFAYQNLLLYYDSDTQWPSVYKSNKTCEEKQSILKRELLQIVPLVPEELDSGCVEISRPKKKGPSSIFCNSSKSFRSARERWWFLAVSHCNFSKGLSIKYSFLMTNGAPGDYWHEHFSADEFYIMPLLMGFSMLYILVILAAVVCCKELKTRQLLHSTYKLFFCSVVLQEVGIFVQSIAYIQFAVSGLDSVTIRDIGRLCESASEIVFLLVLLLLAKGYTVTRGRLRLASSVKLTIFMYMYTACYCFLFLFEKQYFDPGEVLYIYESPAGYGLIGLRIVAWWMFIYSTIFTLKHYPEKATFYYPFNLIGTLW
ncbi:hypothetical protein J6590_060724 [Homalodisca vitripennis]|nr:hypothetical protein J6590_060724 [Homalodisca vitripennis]